MRSTQAETLPSLASISESFGEYTVTTARRPSVTDGHESEAVFAGLSEGALFVERYCPMSTRWIPAAALSVEV